jgi:putative transposase
MVMATRKRYSPEQVVRKLTTADRLLAEGKDVAAVCRELGVSEQTYHRWRNQFGGLKADDAKRLKDLERENSTLKRLLAEGFRNAYADARGEGWNVNHKRVQRLWREEGLRVPQRRRRKRIGTSTAPDRPRADAPNRVWAVDFQFDATTDGRPVKIVSSVDEHTRECLGGLVDRSITADRLIDELDRIALDRGYPAVLRCDNGPELACAAMADWAGERVGLSFTPPGEPWRNGYVESFNSRVRDECLDINIFWSLAHARVVITDWKHDYNTRRRHSSLGYQTPADHAAVCTHR